MLCTRLQDNADTMELNFSLCRGRADDKDMNNSFVVGNKTMKLENIRDHEHGTCHTACVTLCSTRAVL